MSRRLRRASNSINTMLLVSIVSLAAAMGIPVLVRSLQHGMSPNILTEMQRIANALDEYRLRQHDGSYPPDLSRLMPAFVFPAGSGEIAPGTLSLRTGSYRVYYLPEAPLPDGRIERFVLCARPEGGRRIVSEAFITDEGGTLYRDSGPAPGTIDPADEALSRPQFRFADRGG